MCPVVEEKASDTTYGWSNYTADTQDYFYTEDHLEINPLIEEVWSS